MAKKRLTRKQLLKEPDEFITTTGRVIAWAKANTKALIIGVVLFFTLIIGVSVYGFINEKRSSTAHMLYGQAVEKYREQAAQKNEAEALSAVSDDFNALIDTYGSLPAGQLGRIFYGHISVAAKAYDQAILHYKKALDDLHDDFPLARIIFNGLATAYQQKGEYPQAVENYRKIVDGPGSMLKDAALFNLGRLYTQLGKPEQSRKAYQQLSTDFPDSIYADIVREKIAG